MITPPTTTSQTASPPASSQRNTVLTSDFDTFLRMLTVQIRNQDPLNPLQSTEFATQLATFAGVEQQVRMNEKLSALSAQMGVSTMADLAGWIGMEVRVSAPVAFGGTPVALVADMPALAASATLTVSDARGTVVSTEAFPTGTDPVSWAGTGSDGRPLPSGQYTMTLEAFDAEGTSLGEQTVSHYTTVIEARSAANGKGSDLVLQGGAVVPATTVMALRRGQPL